MNRQPRAPMTARAAHSGFSLVELMIAMTIGLVLLAGVGYVYLNARGSFNSMEALASLQETARFNFEYMGEDIRMAGHTGGPASGGSPVNAVKTPTGFDPGLIALFDRPLMGYEQGGTFPSGISPLSGTDAITLVRADADRAYNLCLDGDVDSACLAANPPGTFVLRFAACPSSDLPETGQILAVSDYTHAALFQVTSANACASGSMTLGYATSGGTPGNATTDLGAFSGAIKARTLHPLRASTYYVANNADGVPTLYLQELTGAAGVASTRVIELAEWVTDMQITYGVDTDAAEPLSVDVYRDADAVTDWSRVLSVRVRLDLTSRQDVMVTTSGTALEKTFTATFALRNRLL